MHTGVIDLKAVRLPHVAWSRGRIICSASRSLIPFVVAWLADRLELIRQRSKALGKWFSCARSARLVSRSGVLLLCPGISTSWPFARRYRLAPEHPFPAAFDDALALTRYVYDNAKQLGVDRRKIMISGDSAGGNLAAGVAVVMREKIALQVSTTCVCDSNA